MADSVLSKLEGKYGVGRSGPAASPDLSSPFVGVQALTGMNGDAVPAMKDSSLGLVKTGDDGSGIAIVNDGGREKSWRESEPVYMLSCFLKEYKAFGFYLRVDRSGNPVIQFRPGLQSKEMDQERWDLAEHALYLRDQAEEDLKALMKSGALVIKKVEF